MDGGGKWKVGCLEREKKRQWQKKRWVGDAKQKEGWFEGRKQGRGWERKQNEGYGTVSAKRDTKYGEK